MKYYGAPYKGLPGKYDLTKLQPFDNPLKKVCHSFNSQIPLHVKNSLRKKNQLFGQIRNHSSGMGTPT